ncbi:MAG: hypothetical protein HYR60_18755 [Acidobacteria bacterium]|nr:hypothetical protein [Acidobacteriota bacterium]
MPLSPLRTALLALLLAFLSQALTVYTQFGGDWTSLFLAGSKYPVPPTLAGDSFYVFPNSGGYDSQFYHLMAHDPLMTRGLKDSIDAPRLRYRRVLIPWLAWLAGAGASAGIHAALVGINLLFTFLGAWWLSRYAVLHGASPAWGLAFLPLPAVLIGLDRLTTDLPLAALCVAFALYVKTAEQWKLYLVLALAALARETGLLLLGGYGLALLLRRQLGRAILFGTAAFPALAWYLSVQLRTVTYESHMGLGGPSGLPLPASAFLYRFLEPVTYARPPVIAWTAVALDYVSLGGILAALILAVWVFARKTIGPTGWAALLFVLLVVAAGGIVGWYDPCGYPRVLTPLLLFLALEGFSRRSWLLAAPLALVTPRLFVLTPQFVGAFLRHVFSVP